jgi:phosphoadenosine phosphosulfate reductase
MKPEKIAELNEKYAKATPVEILAICAKQFKDKITFSSSFGIEDQYIAHLIFTKSLNIPVFTLDTGRLSQDTYSLMDRTREKYKTMIQVYFPDFAQVEEMVNAHGLNLFYDSVEKRKMCCQIRKIQPLTRALQNKKCWITGLRREQSENRADLNIFEWDEEFKLVKANPLLHMLEEDLWKIIHKENIPYNKLHDRGYRSIGCLPCTRPVGDGEQARDGRWWWEDNSKKECGLHNHGNK